VSEIEKTNFTFAILYKAARSALEDARANPDGRDWKCLHCLVCTAFSLEAFLNHVGDERLGCWTDLERRLSPKDKVTLLLELAGTSPRWGQEPFQSFDKLLRYRNELAHGKTETLSDGQKGTVEVDIGGLLLPAKPWERECTDPAGVGALHDRAREFMQEISEAVLGKPVDLNMLWSGGGSSA